MRPFVIKTLVLASPFLVLAAIVVAVDPYNFVHVSRFVSDDIKMRTAVVLNPCIWRMTEYRRSPVPNILLGDSRMAELPESEVTGVAGVPYFNFSYGGASLNEIVDTFWFAASRNKLQNVYIGINFTLYSDYNYTARTEAVRALFDNPLLYFTNRTVLKATYYTSRMALTGADPKLGVPPMTREEYWQNTLGPLTESFYGRYVRPARYRKDLAKISEYCRNNGIRLRFIVFPSHVELQARVRDFHLEDEYTKYKQDLASFAVTYDYDYMNAITTDRDNYRDPMHFVQRITSILIREIWAGPMMVGRQL